MRHRNEEYYLTRLHVTWHPQHSCQRDINFDLFFLLKQQVHSARLVTCVAFATMLSPFVNISFVMVTMIFRVNTKNKETDWAIFLRMYTHTHNLKQDIIYFK